MRACQQSLHCPSVPEDMDVDQALAVEEAKALDVLKIGLNLQIYVEPGLGKVSFLAKACAAVVDVSNNLPQVQRSACTLSMIFFAPLFALIVGKFEIKLKKDMSIVD